MFRGGQICVTRQVRAELHRNGIPLCRGYWQACHRIFLHKDVSTLPAAQNESTEDGGTEKLSQGKQVYEVNFNFDSDDKDGDSVQSATYSQYRSTNCHERGQDKLGNFPNDGAQRLAAPILKGPLSTPRARFKQT